MDKFIWVFRSTGDYNYRGGRALEYIKPIQRVDDPTGENSIYFGYQVSKNINWLSISHTLYRTIEED